MRYLILFLFFSMFLFSCAKPEPRDKDKSVSERVADTHSEVTCTEPEMNHYTLVRTDVVQLGHITGCAVIAKNPTKAMAIAERKLGDLWSNEYVKCEFKTKSTETKEGITGVFTNAPPCKCE